MKQGLTLPSIVVHCDWSVSPQKRWMARAVLRNGRYCAQAPELVGDLRVADHGPDLFLDRISRDRRNYAAENRAALIGFDFPIGLPKAYAARRNICEFLPFLKSLQASAPFFCVCREQSEISLHRPFYPFAPGHKKRRQLEDALGIPYSDLLRDCEKRHGERAEACALFWTLGANQVGKAAIVGWRDVLIPALAADQIKLWPFHGSLDSLLQSGAAVVAETYPAEYYTGIFGGLDGSKSNQEVRSKASGRILDWAQSNQEHLQLSGELRREIEKGFLIGADDAFDAVIGLFGMIEVTLGTRSPGEPHDPTIRDVEGWILGQSCP